VSEAALTGLLGDRTQPAVPADEYRWVELARQGNLAAFDEIMLRYEQRLLRFLVGMVHDIDTAQELCQETFLAAYRALPRMTGEVRLSAWLHTIALNQARSHYRRPRVRLDVPLPDFDLPSRGPDVQDSVAARDLVQRIMARLPEKQVEILLLQVTGGLSCREIADLVGASESAVKVRLFRAREAFRRAYDTEMSECAS